MTCWDRRRVPALVLALLAALLATAASAPADCVTTFNAQLVLRVDNCTALSGLEQCFLQALVDMQATSDDFPALRDFVKLVIAENPRCNATIQPNVKTNNGSLTLDAASILFRERGQYRTLDSLQQATRSALLASPDLSTLIQAGASRAVVTETTRATQSEAAISTALATAMSASASALASLPATVSAEASRAAAAEAALSSALAVTAAAQQGTAGQVAALSAQAQLLSTSVQTQVTGSLAPLQLQVSAAVTALNSSQIQTAALVQGLSTRTSAAESTLVAHAAAISTLQTTQVGSSSTLQQQMTAGIAALNSSQLQTSSLLQTQSAILAQAVASLALTQQSASSGVAALTAQTASLAALAAGQSAALLTVQASVAAALLSLNGSQVSQLQLQQTQTSTLLQAQAAATASLSTAQQATASSVATLTTNLNTAQTAIVSNAALAAAISASVSSQASTLQQLASGLLATQAAATTTTAAQSTALSSLSASSAVQSALIAAVITTTSAQAAAISTVTSNITTNTAQISSLSATVVSQAAQISTLTSALSASQSLNSNYTVLLGKVLNCSLQNSFYRTDLDSCVVATTAAAVGSVLNPANNCSHVMSANPAAASGVYYVFTSARLSVQVYCDFTTFDEFGETGWMLVGAWFTDYLWSASCVTTANPILNENANTWSANFGDLTVNQIRIQSATSITSTGSNAKADWYYYYPVAHRWSLTFGQAPGTGHAYCSDTPRNSMKQFDHAFNIKYGYATVSQYFDNLSDGDCIANWGAAWIDAVTPFTTPATLDIRGYAGDGSFGIVPQASVQTAAGQDTSGNNVQVGSDDNNQISWFGTSATASTPTNNIVDVANSGHLYVWVKSRLFRSFVGSRLRPADNCSHVLSSDPLARSGVYFVNIPGRSSNPLAVYCDLVTRDEFGGTGWMLAAAFLVDNLWGHAHTTTTNPILSAADNTWSSNFGNLNINFMRIHGAPHVDQTGPASRGDWYYYWATPHTWKSTFSQTQTTGSYYCSSLPRMAVKPFSSAYNLRYSYRAGNQLENSLSDGTCIGSTYPTWPDLATPLVTPGVFDIYSYAQDGSFAISPISSSQVGFGQDTDGGNAKVGYDDDNVCSYYGSAATASAGGNNCNDVTQSTHLYIWIK